MALKCIICGTGRAGTYLHFGALKAAGVEVVAFVDVDGKRAEEAARRYGVKSFYQSLEEALSKEKEVDFVDICTNTKSHLPLCRIALEHSCHVLVEKPLTDTMEELNILEMLKRRYGKIICVVHNHKFYPGMVKLRAMVKSGALGQILSVYREMSFTYENVRMMEEGHWAHSIPGGRLFEANPHNLYLLYSLVGKMDLVDVYPRKISDRWPYVKVDEFLALLKTENSTVTIKMSINCTAEGYGKHGPNFILVVGSRKTVLATYYDVFPLESMGRFEWDRVVSKAIRKIQKRKESVFTDTYGKTINIGTSSGHRWLIERFVDYLEGRSTEEPVPFDEAYYVQKANLEMGLLVEKKVKSNGNA